MVEDAERDDEGSIALAAAYFLSSTHNAAEGREPWQVEGLNHAYPLYTHRYQC